MTLDRQVTLDEAIEFAKAREHHNPPHDEQARQLARVTSRIGRACLDFARAHVGREFVGEYLLRWVRTATGRNVAPDSPRRVMSELEAQGHVKLECVSRAGSRYRVVGVANV